MRGKAAKCALVNVQYCLNRVFGARNAPRDDNDVRITPVFQSLHQVAADAVLYPVAPHNATMLSNRQHGDELQVLLILAENARPLRQ